MTSAFAGNQRAVVICDHNGQRTGTGTVDDVHRGGGILHKAFSVFVFRNSGAELLLQQRSPQKTRFPSCWANTCCSHASPADESIVAAARQRLVEELGFSVALREAGAFVYRAKDPGNDVTEYEHDTVLVGSVGDAISVNPAPAEVAAWRWVSVRDLKRALREQPEQYAPWLPEALRIALAAIRARPAQRPTSP
jgi:isopentenyl-diphosphate Delta-isomerase